MCHGHLKNTVPYSIVSVGQEAYPVSWQSACRWQSKTWW